MHLRYLDSINIESFLLDSTRRRGHPEIRDSGSHRGELQHLRLQLDPRGN